MFLSIVPPAFAFTLATSVAGFVQRAGKGLVYVDFNAVSPRRAAAIGEVVTTAGCDFVDGGIIGFPPQPGLPGARFWISGPSVREALPLSDYGLDMRVAGARIGQASAVKMSYAAITKGLTAIGIESLVSALEADVYGSLVAELKSSQAPLAEWLEHMLLTSPPKAYRWIAEMEEIADTFESAGWPDQIFRGAAAVYQQVAETAPGRETPETRTDRPLAVLVEQIAHPDSTAVQ
jgi:3-hydroxyisobutyrate dehydrogenase-like beta-hydroxyacid dehydrogenase